MNKSYKGELILSLTIALAVILLNLIVFGLATFLHKITN